MLTITPNYFTNQINLKNKQQKQINNNQTANLKPVPTDLARVYFMPANSKKIGFKGIDRFRVAKGFDESVATSLKRALEQFEESPTKHAKQIGEGLCSRVFKFVRLPYVVKESKGFETYDRESHILEKIPTTVENSQKFVACAHGTKENKNYLVTTFVEGTESQKSPVPLTRSHFDSLFDGLSKLDEKGLYHGDLHPGNILVTDDGKANIIDYEWGEKIKKRNFFNEEIKRNRQFPDFIMPANAQMLETAAIPEYLSKSNHPKTTFTDYLKAKSSYHTKRASFIETRILKKQGKISPAELMIMKKAKRYEECSTKVLKNPSDDVIRLEAQRIQFLHHFREGFGYIDPNAKRNILGGISSYINAVKSVRQYKRSLTELQPTATGDMKDYLNFHKEYADYWDGFLTKCLCGKPGDQGIFRWLLKGCQGIEDIGSQIKRNLDKPITPTIDVEKLVTGNNSAHLSSGEIKKNDIIIENMKKTVQATNSQDRDKFLDVAEKAFQSSFS